VSVGTDNEDDRLIGERSDEVCDVDELTSNGSTDTECTRREILCDGVLDDLEEDIRTISGSDLEFIEELDHQTGETLESTGNTHAGRDVDEDVAGGLDVHLQVTSLVERRIKESEEALVKDVGAIISSGFVQLLQEGSVCVCCNELDAALRLDCFKTSVGHHNDHLLLVINL